MLAMVPGPRPGGERVAFFLTLMGRGCWERPRPTLEIGGSGQLSVPRQGARENPWDFVGVPRAVSRRGCVIRVTEGLVLA